MKILKETRIGHGIDVHQFSSSSEDNKDLYLCGIKIPYNKGLKGHSDADVVLHALTDAILGALCLGDIGEYFPPSDMQWKGEPSSTFLKFAHNKLLQNNGKIINIDINILAEEPKINPYKKNMVKNLEKILNLQPNRVNIKATTFEEMGSIGRKEGIVATASISIEIN